MSTNPVSGNVRIRATGVCMTRSSTFRGRADSARRARVNGAASASGIGATVARTMCCVACALKATSA